MNIHSPYLAAEHVSTRHHEAQQLRLGERVARSRRLSRRAARLADRARLTEDRIA
jgi:hypothetical protein